jgi:CheY-like chemotaxis protein
MAIVNDILDSSKIEAGKLTFETVDFDLVETVESTLDMMAERAHSRGIELGEGSNFWFTVQLEKQTGHARSYAPSGAPFAAEPKARIEDVRILLAEDNSINQRVALGQLEKLHYAAKAVRDGLEVLRSLEQISYHVIFMDCQMQEMDGYEATRAIRQREQNIESPCPWKSPIYIIAMTANAMAHDREKCLAVGIDDYLSKPVQASELQAALERWKQAVQ